MYLIKLSNGKNFEGDSQTTIFASAQKAGVLLEHSCLAARCKSCKVKILLGKSSNVHDEFVLSPEEKLEGVVLSCNSIPESDMILEAEDLSDWDLPKSRTLPSKIHSIEYLNDSVLKVELRLPPKSLFRFISGQYVNLIKGNIKRSYSIANNYQEEGMLQFMIKNYPNGIMSKYWFEEASINDLIRLEGPLGTFFLRNSAVKEIVFLATGTGIAPIKSIVEELFQRDMDKFDKNITVIWGGRKRSDIYWTPPINNGKLKFIPVLSRHDENWNGERGYVQDVLLKEVSNSLKDIQVYACGSKDMIEDAHIKLVKNGLPENQFFSDAFVSSN